MTPETMTFDPVQLGIVGIALMIVWRVLGLIQQMITKKNGGEVKSTIDVEHFKDITDLHRFIELAQRIKDIHDYTIRAQQSEDRGRHSCLWNSRDEVVTMVSTMKEILTEIVGLRADIRAAIDKKVL